ncbi:O-antigen ligase family protein, partial [Candidatus Peregrinibacteria bacterium]|nr:O-antigen ligase family protein [Candidatus Peregrinibacteria bacterium]
MKFSRVVLVINLFALVFTLARGAWLALLFIFPLIIAIKKKSVVLLHKHKTFVISISLLVSVVVFLGVINDLNYTNNTNLTTRTLTNIHQQPLNFKARLGYYSRALSRFKHRLPWGTGLNTYTNSQSKVSHSNGITSYVHSFLLQILTETGIFSALSFLIILTYITRQLFVAARNSSDTTISGVFYAFTLSLIYSFYDFNLNTSLVFLTIFSLAISVIYDPRQKKVSPLERTGQTINFLVIFYLFLLLSFIVLGLYSTMISTKADKLVLNENHQEAYKLYLNSMKIFPYSNSNFEKTILYLDDYFPEKSHSLIQKWIRLNNNNGAMYTFLANRSLDSLDLNTSLEYMNISLSSGYEPSPSSETVKLALKFISHSSKTTLDPQIVRFIHLLNNFSLNHPVKYLDWEISEFYYQATLHLVYNLSFDTLIIQDKKIILESALDGFFILDINENAHIINLLDRLIILNSNNQLYSQYKNILVSLSYSETSLQTIDQLISNLKPNIKASHLPQVSNVLLSHLYISKSKYYQSDNTVEELEYIDKAIQASPFTSSFRIYKAARLKDLGLMKESKNAL